MARIKNNFYYDKYSSRNTISSAGNKLVRRLNDGLGPYYQLKSLYIEFFPDVHVDVHISKALNEPQDRINEGNPAYVLQNAIHKYSTDENGAGVENWPDINGDWCHANTNPDGIKGFFKKGVLSIDNSSERARIETYTDVIYNQLRAARLDPTDLSITRSFMAVDPLLEPTELYRTESYSGSGVRRIEDIIEYEVYELHNIDILEYCQTHYALSKDVRLDIIDTIHLMSNGHQLQVDRDKLRLRELIKRMLDDIYRQTGTRPRYGLWLADKDTVIKQYGGTEDNIDAYFPSDIVLSRLGPDGTLYCYSEEPEPVANHHESDSPLPNPWHVAEECNTPDPLNQRVRRIEGPSGLSLYTRTNLDDNYGNEGISQLFFDLAEFACMTAMYTFPDTPENIDKLLHDLNNAWMIATVQNDYDAAMKEFKRMIVESI